MSIRDTVLKYAADPEQLAKDLDVETSINRANTFEDTLEVSRRYTYWGQLLACAEDLYAAHNDLHKRATAEAKEKTRERLDKIGDKATDGRAADLSILDQEVIKQARFVRILQRTCKAIEAGVHGLSKKQFMLTHVMNRDKAEFGNIPLETLTQNYRNQFAAKES